MSVQPITDSNSQLKWISQRNKTQKKHEESFSGIKDEIAFITDFSSTADYNRSAAASKIKAGKQEKKSRPLSYTSENWIG